MIKRPPTRKSNRQRGRVSHTALSGVRAGGIGTSPGGELPPGTEELIALAIAEALPPETP